MKTLAVKNLIVLESGLVVCVMNDDAPQADVATARQIMIVMKTIPRAN